MWKRIKAPKGPLILFLTKNKFFPHFFQVSSFPHFLFIPQNFYKFFPSKFFCDNTLPHSFFSLRCYVKQTFINVGRYLLSYFFQIWYSGSGCVIELLKKLWEIKKLVFQYNKSFIFFKITMYLKISYSRFPIMKYSKLPNNSNPDPVFEKTHFFI